METNEEKIYTVYVIKYKGDVKYVGKTCDFKRRVYEHRCRIGTHKSAIPIDADLNEVTFVPIETFDNEVDALKREDELIQTYDTMNTGWNKQRSGLIDVSDVNAYHRNYNRKYSKTEKYKAYKREYNNTSEYKAWKMKYNQQYRKEHRDELREKRRLYRLRKKAENRLRLIM